MCAIGRGGVSEGNEQNGGGGERGGGRKVSKAKWTPAGIKMTGGQICLEIQQNDGRPPWPNTTNSRRAMRAADSLSLGPASAMPQRPAEVSFWGSSARAGRAGSARQPFSDEPTQKTSTVTGLHKYARK